jgi:molybdopterin-biosynthesis enzyme MoeA-like protein
MTTRQAAALIIGNEVLTGRTQDANLGYIGQKMMGAGIRLAHARVVADVEADIIRSVNECRAMYDYVFTTGGIGPTHDDITAASVAKAFGVPHEMNTEARARLLKHYGSEDLLIPARLRMAMVPRGAVLIDNPVSGAPGFQLENVYVLAGVPRIMQAMLDGIVPHLQGGPPIETRTINCFIAESRIADDLTRLAADYADVDIGSYPYFSPNQYGLSLVLRGSDVARLEAATRELFSLVARLGGNPELQAVAAA